MKDGVVLSRDGVALRFSVSDFSEGRPWIALIIPFGLRVTIAKPFFDFFQTQYNVVSWESRLILDEERESVLPQSAFDLRRHVDDFEAVLSSCNVQQCVVVGYCSGAGVALGAANRYPQRISSIALVHGEYVLLDQPDCRTQFAREVDSLLSMAHSSEDHLRRIFEKIKNERLDDGHGRPADIDLPYSELPYLRRYAQNYQSYKREDFRKLATFVGHPTLLMSGKRDAQANVASTIAIGNAMPNSTLYVDDNADHYGILRDDSGTLIALWNHLSARALRCA